MKHLNAFAMVLYFEVDPSSHLYSCHVILMCLIDGLLVLFVDVDDQVSNGWNLKWCAGNFNQFITGCFQDVV